MNKTLVEFQQQTCFAVCLEISAYYRTCALSSLSHRLLYSLHNDCLKNIYRGLEEKYGHGKSQSESVSNLTQYQYM